MEQLSKHRAYVLTFVLNLAILIGVVYILRRPEPRVISVLTPVPRSTDLTIRSGEISLPTPATPLPSALPVRAAPQEKVNINTASVEELDALPHIGPVLAQRIADYRSKQGPFQDIQDIKQVAGIGDAVFHDLQDLITVE